MRRDELEAFKSRINEEMSVAEGLFGAFKGGIGKTGEANANATERAAAQRQADEDKARKAEEQNQLNQLKRERDLGNAEANYNYHKNLNDFYNGLKNKVGGFVNRVGKKVGNTAQSAVQDTKKDIHNAANQAQTQAHVQDNRERPAAQPAEKKSLGQRFGDGLKNLKTNYGKLKTADREESKLQQEKEDLTNKIDARDAKFKDMPKQDYATFVEPYKTSAEKADDKNLKNVSNKIEQNQENAKAHPVLNTVAKGQNKVEDIAGQLKDNFKSKDPKQLKLDFKAAEKAEKEQQKQADEEAKKAREVKVANDGQTKLDLGGLEGKTKTIDPEKKPLMDKVKDGLKNVTDKFKKPEAEEQQPKQPEVQNDDTNDNTNITSNTNRRKFQLGDKDVSLPKLIKYQQMDDYDSYGRDAYGFDKDGFYRNGFNRKGINKETGTQFDKDGFNIYGFDKDGINKETGTQFDKDGFDLNGFDKNGFDSKGFDKNNINKETGTEFDKDGFNINGLDKDGFNKSGYNEKGVDREGYSHDGFNKDGYDRNGFDTKGFNKDGVHKETGTQFNKDGFNKDGYSKYGFNKSNFNKDGINKFTGTKFDKDGYDSKGFNKAGFDRAGYDSNGFNKAGFNKEGISKETGTQFNKAGFDKDGFDKDGFDKDGFNIIGYNKEGFNRAGYDKHGRDNYGFNKDGFDEYGISKETGTEFNKEGFNKDGIHKETGTEYNKDGFDKYGNPDPSMQQTNTTNNQQQTNTTNNQQTKKSLKDKVADAAYGAIKGANKNMQYAKNVINKKIPYVAQQGRDEGDAAFAANNPNIPMGNNNQQQNQQAAQQTTNPYLAQAQAAMAAMPMFNPYVMNPYMMPYMNMANPAMMGGMNMGGVNPQQVNAQTVGQGLQQNQPQAPTPQTAPQQPTNNGNGINLGQAVQTAMNNTYGNNATQSADTDYAPDANMTAAIRAKLENGDSPDSFSPEERQAYDYYNQNGLIKDGRLAADDELTQHFNTRSINNDIANNAVNNVTKQTPNVNNVKQNLENNKQSTDNNVEQQPVEDTIDNEQPISGQPTQEVETPTETKDNTEEIDNSNLSDDVKNVTETPTYHKAFVTRVRNQIKNGVDPSTLTGKSKEVYDNVISKETPDDKPQVNLQGVKNKSQGESEEVTDNQESVTQDSQDNNQGTITNKEEQNPPANNTTTETENTETVINPSEEQSKKADAYVPKAVTVRNFREHIKDEKNLNKLIEKVKNGGSLSDSNSKIAAKVLKLTGGKTDKDSIASALRTLENGDDSNYKVKRQDRDTVTFNQGANEFGISGADNVNKFYDIANKIQKAVQDKKIEIDDFGDLSDSKVKSDGDKLDKLLKDLSTTISGSTNANKKVQDEAISTQANTIAKMIAKGTLHIKEDGLDENGNPKFKMVEDKRPWETRQKQEAQYWESPAGKKEEKTTFKVEELPSGKAQGAGTPASGKDKTGYGNGRAYKVSLVANDLGMQRATFTRDDVDALLDLINQGYVPDLSENPNDLKDPKGHYSKDEKDLFESLIKVGAIKRKYDRATDQESYSVNNLYDFRNLLGRRYYNPNDNETLSYTANSGIYTPDALELLSLHELKPYTAKANSLLKQFKPEEIYTREALNTIKDTGTKPFTEGADNYLQHVDYKDGYEMNTIPVNDVVTDNKKVSALVDNKSNRLNAPLDSINNVITMVKSGKGFKDAKELAQLAEKEGIIKNEQDEKDLGAAFIALKNSGILKVTADDKNEKTGFKLADNRIGNLVEDGEGNYSFEKGYKSHRQFHNSDKDEKQQSNFITNKETGFDEVTELPKGVLLRDFNKIMEKVNKGRKIAEDDRLQDVIKTLKENGIDVNKYQDGYRDFNTGKIVLEPKAPKTVNTTNFELAGGMPINDLKQAITKMKNGTELSKREKKHVEAFKVATGLNNKSIKGIDTDKIIKNSDGTYAIHDYNKPTPKEEVETKGLGESIMALRLKQKIMNLV